MDVIRSRIDGKDYNTTWIPDTQLRDVYLPPFKAAVDAGVGSFMCSFNDINGLSMLSNLHINWCGRMNLMELLLTLLSGI